MIRLSPLAILAALQFSSCSIAQEPAVQPASGVNRSSQDDLIPATFALEDVRLSRKALEDIHPGYADFITSSELDTMWDALEARVSYGISQTELYLSLAEIVAAIRCDHTKIELSRDMVAQRDDVPVYLPFRFKVFDGRMYVDAPGTTGLERGAEILSIDGVSAQTRLSEAAGYMSVDGFTDHVRWLNLEQSSEELGSGFDHYDPLLRPDDDKVIIEAKTINGTKSTITLNRITYSAYRAITGEQRYSNFSDEDAITVTFPDDGVAYISVNTFVNYRTPIDPMEAFRPIFEDFEARDINTLIVDNRENGGGSTDVQNALIAHLLNGKITPVSDIRVKTIDVSAFKPHLSTWEALALDPPPEAFIDHGDGWYSIRKELQDSLQGFDAAESSFDGQLILLTSHSNASGATQMTGVLSQRPNTILVGEPTGGTQRGPNGGVIYYLTLPNSGFVVRIPWQTWRSNIENPEFGKGFDPDISAPVTYKSWLANEDVAMNAAIKLVSQ